MIRKIINKIKYKLFIKNNKKRLNNKELTILTNNCMAGIIYHELGLKFNSPTINLFIKKDEFLNLVNHLKEYENSKLIEIKEDGIDYPIGKLINKKYGDITIYFMHYNSFEEAKEKWIERYKRIDYDNIYVILDVGPEKEFKPSLLKEFDKLSYNHKIALVPSKYKGKNYYSISCYDNNWHSGQIFEFNPKTGKKYLHEWDYVEFFNKKM